MIVEVDDGPDDFDDDEVNAYVAEFQANISRADEIADAVGGGCLTIAAKIDDPQWGNRPKE